MTTIFIDTETSGLPKTRGWDDYYSYTDSAKYDSSRLVQICWIVCDGEEVKVKKTFTVRPEGFEISEQVTKIHGITHEHACLNGDSVLKELEADIKANNIRRLVAHNVRFDFNIVMSELHRQKMLGAADMMGSMKLKCTMSASKDVCRIPSKWNPKQFKSPSLKELYEFLHPGETFELKHRADWDTEHCMKCYFALRKLALNAECDEDQHKK